MNKAIIAGSLLLASVCYAADYYKVAVTREDSNLYKMDDSDLYIRTKSCYQYASSDKALLVWNGNGTYDENRLLFLRYDGSVKDTCDVVSLFREVKLN
jgi:hypothetical protein